MVRATAMPLFECGGGSGKATTPQGTAQPPPAKDLDLIASTRVGHVARGGVALQAAGGGRQVSEKAAV